MNAVLFVAVVVVVGVCVVHATKQPNVVVFLTDDQDILTRSYDSFEKVMPNLHERMILEGVRFSNAFVNSPVCCPSRSTILTGRYIHNHGAHNNSIGGNCSSTAWQQGPEKESIATFMEKENYYSLYAGKYLNAFGLVGNSRYYNYSVSDNGVEEKHGDDYEHDYFTDVLKRRSVKFLNNWRQNVSSSGKPFFLMVGTPACHANFEPAPQYNHTFDGVKAPRLPSFNAASPDKHALLRELHPMSQFVIDEVDEIHRRRWETLRSVDDLVGEVFDLVEQAGQLDNTYFVFTSDHGFHLGEFRMSFDKRQLYETDIRVPCVIRGPNIQANTETDVIVTAIDIAPTVYAMAQSSSTTPEVMDGRSVLDLITTTITTTTTTERDVRLPATETFLVEYYGEGQAGADPGPGVVQCGCGIEGLPPSPCDSWNNTYSCLRTIHKKEEDSMFCQFVCFGSDRNVVPCPSHLPEGQGEFYDLRTNPYQLRNQIKELSPQEKQRRVDLLHKYKACQGWRSCNFITG